MAFEGSYSCTKCNKTTERKSLVVKKVMFQEIGANPATIRSRSVAWLCAPCVAADPDYNRPVHDSPGLRLAKEASGAG